MILLTVDEIIQLHTKEELIALGLSVADGSYDYPAIWKWIQSHEK